MCSKKTQNLSKLPFICLNYGFSLLFPSFLQMLEFLLFHLCSNICLHMKRTNSGQRANIALPVSLELFPWTGIRFCSSLLPGLLWFSSDPSPSKQTSPQLFLIPTLSLMWRKDLICFSKVRTYIFAGLCVAWSPYLYLSPQLHFAVAGHHAADEGGTLPWLVAEWFHPVLTGTLLISP